MNADALTLTQQDRSERPRAGHSRKIRTAARLFLRNVYAACLDPIPDGYLLAIRDAYVNAPRASFAHRLLFRVLNCLRYKHPDRRIASFPLPDAPALRLHNVDSIIVRHLYWFGLYGSPWESAELRAWQYFAARATKILEIGANIGVYTICGASSARGADYTAVEPHPHTSRVLRRNLALNDLNEVNVVEAAVVGTKAFDRMTLMIPAADQDETPSGSFLAAAGERPCQVSASWDVPVAGIRDLMRGVDLLKLDVEGYEYDILNAVRDVLLRDQPVLFVEVLPEAVKLQRFLADLAREAPYRLFAAGRTIEEIDPAALDTGVSSRHDLRDIVMVPAHRRFGLRDIAIGRETESA